MMKALMSAFALALAAPVALAQSASIGPEVGSTAPAITATLADGAEASLAGLSGENGVALVFVRSADWCPFCKNQMKDLSAVVGPLSEKGYGLAAISYDSAEILSNFATKEGISYPLLSDAGSVTITAFGLLNTEMKEGSRFYGVPHPAIVFIGADGTVQAVLREEGYKDRPAADVILGTASELSAN